MAAPERGGDCIGNARLLQCAGGVERIPAMALYWWQIYLTVPGIRRLWRKRSMIREVELAGLGLACISYVPAFILGTILGSFSNVLIFRLPRKESIVWPSSFCPQCRKPIAPWDNIPLVSYVLLGGRCRSCKAPIHWRYPLVEGVSGVLYVMLFARYGWQATFFFYAAFASALVVITAIDLEHYIIPHAITYPGIAVGLAGSALVLPVPFKSALLGAAIGMGFLSAVAAASLLILRREGMGGGDIALVGMIGAFLGWQALVVAVMIALITGSAVAIVLIALRKRGRKDAVPFGPFLAVGALASLLYGELILTWYTNLLYPGL